MSERLQREAARIAELTGGDINQILANLHLANLEFQADVQPRVLPGSSRPIDPDKAYFHGSPLIGYEPNLQGLYVHEGASEESRKDSGRRRYRTGREGQTSSVGDRFPGRLPPADSIHVFASAANPETWAHEYRHQALGFLSEGGNRIRDAMTARTPKDWQNAVVMHMDMMRRKGKSPSYFEAEEDLVRAIESNKDLALKSTIQTEESRLRGEGGNSLTDEEREIIERMFRQGTSRWQDFVYGMPPQDQISNYAGGGMTEYKMKPMADALASRGRYGDSELVHINKAELAGIASLAPGGKLTINPDTGLQEAFLPFLAPILGSVLGTSFLPGLASAAGLGGLGSALAASPALAGAIGSGLATGLAENSLEKGLIAGVTGFGLGSALGGVGGAAKEGVKQAAQEAAKRSVGDIAGAAAESGALEGLTNVGAGYVPEAGFEALVMNAAPSTAQAAQAAQAAGTALPTTFGGAMQQGMSNLSNIGANLGEVGTNLMQPGTMLPVAYGLGSLANLNAMDARRDAYNRRRSDSEAERLSWVDLMNQSFSPLSRYQYASGGITSVNPDDYNKRRDGARKFAQGGHVMLDAGGSTGRGDPSIPTAGMALQGTAAQRQAMLRGPYVNAPPEGHRPGIDPEFSFFSQQPTDTTVNLPAEGEPAPGTPNVPGIDPFAPIPNDILSRYRAVARDLGNFHTQNDLSSRNVRNRTQFLDEFTNLRAQYPGLIDLDNELDIDRDYRDIGYTPFGNESVFPQTSGGIMSLPMGIEFPRVYGGRGDAELANESPRMMAEGGSSKLGGNAYGPDGMTEEERELLEKKREYPGWMGKVLGGSPEDLPDPIKKYTLWGGLLSGEGVPEFMKSGSLLGSMMAEGGETYASDAERFTEKDEEKDNSMLRFGLLNRLAPKNAGGPKFMRYSLLGQLMGMAEGGETGEPDELVSETVKAILGEHEDGDMVIQMFVSRHGPEAFAQLRTRVLNGVVPGAQTEGQMKGPGGGMDDKLTGMIGSSQPVALSTDEFVIPADVVSALGDGSSDAGAKVLYDMMDSVRKYKGGSTEQPPKMSPEKLEKIKLGRP